MNKTMRQQPAPVVRRVLTGGAILGAVLAGVGCTGQEAPEPKPPVSPAAPTAEASSADQIIRDMIATYQSAASYTDRGVFRLQYREEGQLLQDTAHLAVQFERPNRLRLQVYQVTLACDGRQLRAMIADERTNNFDGQLVQQPAPEKMSLSLLNAAASYSDDERDNALANGMGGPPIQLELLLAERPLEEMLKSVGKMTLLSGRSIDDRPCDRVQIRTDAGELVFWIDRTSRLLRRLEYPADNISKEMGQSTDVSQVSLVADFTGAMFGAEVPDRAMELVVPKGAKIVSRFVMPPPPLPSDLFGKRPAQFSFSDLDQVTVSQESLDGKYAVLVWFNDHPACNESLRQLQGVYQKYRDDERLNFLAVCTEPTTVGNDRIRDLMQQWGVAVPVVRDLTAYGRDVFHIPWAPTLVVLGADGKLHIFEVGANPNLLTELPTVLERLLAGGDVAAEILQRFERERQDYNRMLAVPSISESPSRPSGTRR